MRANIFNDINKAKTVEDLIGLAQSICAQSNKDRTRMAEIDNEIESLKDERADLDMLMSGANPLTEVKLRIGWMVLSKAGIE